MRCDVNEWLYDKGESKFTKNVEVNNTSISSEQLSLNGTWIKNTHIIWE